MGKNIKLPIVKLKKVQVWQWLCPQCLHYNFKHYQPIEDINTYCQTCGKDVILKEEEGRR